MRGEVLRVHFLKWVGLHIPCCLLLPGLRAMDEQCDGLGLAIMQYGLYVLQLGHGKHNEAIPQASSSRSCHDTLEESTAWKSRVDDTHSVENIAFRQNKVAPIRCTALCSSLS